MSYEAAIA
jgi:hypothetical protein